LVALSQRHMRESGIGPDTFFFHHRGGRGNPGGDLGRLLAAHANPDAANHPLWQEETAPSLVIDTVESLWSAIADHDDWQPLHTKISVIRQLGQALGQSFQRL